VTNPARLMPIDIERAAHAAGVADRPVCLHSSLRSFGWVRGGADGVIDGFLAAGVTLLVPTASARAFATQPPPDHEPLPFNCEQDGSIPLRDKDRVAARFHRSSLSVDPEMGALPAALLRRTPSIRGNHPLSSFTALGPTAEALVAGQTAVDVFAPLRALASRQGAVVLAGVDLTSATILHLAEEQAGLRLLVRWAYDDSGATVAARHGGCSRGFERLSVDLAASEHRYAVGLSTWRVFDAALMLELATRSLRNDPGAATCVGADCGRCREQLSYARAASEPR
jgi:aminoglycoside 3-N-acetyltransferase